MSSQTVPLSAPNLGGNERRYLDECITTEFVSSVGPFVSRFEQAFAAFIGSPSAVACASGTAAIHVALRCAGIGAGDDVLVSDFTFVATANPITYCNARPVFVDADDATWNMDATLVAEELARRASRGLPQPKAVLCAHVLGLPADLDAIEAACAKHGVMLIEDAAEGLGAAYADGRFAGQQVGTIGRLGCFSFNGNKIITTGGGGMVTTADAAFAARAKHLTTQAKLPGVEYLHDEIGYNYRMPNIAAALGVAQLERLNAFIQRKHEITARYDAAFAGLPGVSLPPRPRWARPAIWLYSILLDPAVARVDRRQLLEALRAKGIETRPLWAPSHVMPFFAASACLGGRVGERLFEQGLSLPSSTGLSDQDQDLVIDAVRQLLG